MRHVPTALLIHLSTFSLLMLVVVGCTPEDDPIFNTNTTSSAGTMSVGGDEVSDTAGEAGDDLNTEPELVLPSEPIEGCIGPEGVADIGTPRAVMTESCATCEGEPAPDFVLRDLSPTSCGVGRYYGLDAFIGHVTFVVLLRSTCGYCHGQLEKLELMRIELLAAGYELNMVVINEMNTEGTVDLLTNRSQIPVLQDLPEVDAWGALSSEDAEGARIGGDKDDMYIYDESGALWRFLDDDDPAHLLNLSTEEGYAYLKNTLLEALGE